MSAKIEENSKKLQEIFIRCLPSTEGGNSHCACCNEASEGLMTLMPWAVWDNDGVPVCDKCFKTLDNVKLPIEDYHRMQRILP